MMDGAVSGKTGFTETPDTVMWVRWNRMEKHILWHCLHAAGRTIELINGRIRESLWSMGLPLDELCDLDDIALDGSRFAPVPIEHAQGGRIGEQVYMKLHAVLKKRSLP